MTKRDFRLRQFFGGYFNQDWDIGGSTNWRDVMDDYFIHNSIENILIIRDDLVSWISEVEVNESILMALGCDYDPAPDEMNEQEWVQSIIRYIDNKIFSTY